MSHSNFATFFFCLLLFLLKILKCACRCSFVILTRWTLLGERWIYFVASVDVQAHALSCPKTMSTKAGHERC